VFNYAGEIMIFKTLYLNNLRMCIW